MSRLLPEVPFSREQAVVITIAYRNVFIDDDQGTHFRRVIRNAETDAGRFASDGLLRQ
ncbi:DUF905 family protein [Escherichia coli]|nr:DUF905 family protein [Shigella flexneri]